MATRDRFFVPSLTDEFTRQLVYTEGTMKHPLERQFLHIAKRNWKPHTPLVVALSGGVDSMALFALLNAIQLEWPAHLIPVHVNHQLREVSTDEAKWLQEYLEERFQAALTVVAVDVAPQSGESMEMAARRVRYSVLHQVLDEAGPQARLLTAHQQNDQAETVLMRALQGTGVEGLAAMRNAPQRIVRPLLDISRPQLLAYCQTQKLRWIEDASNQDVSILRNRIRLEVLPFLAREVNPQVYQALAELSKRAQEANQALDAWVKHWEDLGRFSMQNHTLTLERGWETWPRELTVRILKRFARQEGIRITRRHLALAMGRGGVWPGGIVIQDGAGGKRRLARPSKEISTPVTTSMRVHGGGQYRWLQGRLDVVEGFLQDRPGPDWTGINRRRWPVFAVRSWQHGDRLHPLGLLGSKKVQDVFVDQKVPRVERYAWPIVVSPDDPRLILAVPGLAASESARAKDDNTAMYWVRFYNAEK